jgi:uncharacterized protein YndB with AHSA1/START domain
MTMTAAAHVYEIFIRAPRQQVWDALIEPEYTTRYFHGTAIESAFEPGARFVSRVADGGREAVDGTIEVFEPPSRLVYTWHVLYDAAMSEEPPSRVEWTLSPASEDGSVTRVTLRHGDLAMSPKTWASVRVGWVAVLDSLKSLLETGEPLPAVDTGDRGRDEDADGAWHRMQAMSANNSAWELLDGRALGADEADDLLGRAYAAAYHWRRAVGATAVNGARASWLISRCHAVLGHGDLALHHARRAGERVAAAGELAADFDQAYVHEATARALACLGRLDEAEAELKLARAVEIGDPEDRSIVESDLAAEPWFGLVAGTEAAGVR